MCWPSVSNDTNVMVSKGETHEEVQEKQQKSSDEHRQGS